MFGAPGPATALMEGGGESLKAAQEAMLSAGTRLHHAAAAAAVATAAGAAGAVTAANITAANVASTSVAAAALTTSAVSSVAAATVSVAAADTYKSISQQKLRLDGNE